MSQQQRGAGRDLDAEIHARVMGIEWDASRCRVCGWKLAGHIMDGCVADNCAMRPHPYPRADAPPHYSTDIAAAFQVVEKMRDRGAELTLATKFNAWRVHIGFAAPDYRSILEYADTPPLAICRAALAALDSRPSATASLKNSPLGGIAESEP